MHELVAEARRLNRDIARITTQAPPDDEVPLRLHAREIDAGGAPEWHPAFVRWVGPVCTCGRAARCSPNCHFNRDRILGHLDACEPACITATRFRPSKHHNSPLRMKRAFRALRDLNPKVYDFCFLVIARHYTFEQAMARINADNAVRGKAEMSPAEFAVIWVSGASMLSSSF